MKLTPEMLSMMRIQTAMALVATRVGKFGLSLTPGADQDAEIDLCVRMSDRLIECCYATNPAFVARYAEAPMPMPSLFSQIADEDRSDYQPATIAEFKRQAAAAVPDASNAWVDQLLNVTGKPAAVDPDAANAAAANADAVSMAAAGDTST